jgi:hypothetical protein
MSEIQLESSKFCPKCSIVSVALHPQTFHWESKREYFTINVPLIWKVREIIFFSSPCPNPETVSHYEFCPRN